MPADINTATWSETAGSNNAASPDGAPEGMSYAGVNDTIREGMGALKRDWNRSHPVYSSGGTATAITLTFGVPLTAYVQGMQVSFKVTTTCGDAPTLNINGLGAKKVYVMGASGAAQAVAGDMLAAMHVVLTYDTALDAGAGGWFLWGLSQPAGWTTLASTTLAAATTSGTLALPASITRFRLSLQDMTVGTAGAQLVAQFSSDAGATWLTASSYYQQVLLGSASTAFAAQTNPTTSMALTSGIPAASSNPYQAAFEISPGSATLRASIFGTVGGLDTSGAPITGTIHGSWNGSAARMTAIRVIPTSGTYSGTIVLEGRR